MNGAARHAGGAGRGVIGFDHLMVLVDDLEAVAAEASAAGYTLTPPSLMPGLANRLICFSDALPGATSFIEFLQYGDIERVPAVVRNFLGMAPGPAALVIAVEDVAAFGDGLTRQGIAHAEPIAIRRQWAVDGGEILDVHLEVLLIARAGLPVPCVAVRHHTPHHYLRETFVRHRNGATGIPAIVLAAADPGAVAATLGTVFGCPSRETGDGAVVDLPGARLIVRRAKVERTMIVGPHIAVAGHGGAAAPARPLPSAPGLDLIPA
ncbi:VOC family protein [Acuticoccus kandeliae]|uniref:VOC family protein n=1 Tax=Acuticoccus kandeliae TaxID=2073160 RepID=UPI000D3E87E0|nr:VOC family protein [Acuticoccus kandeliae]